MRVLVTNDDGIYAAGLEALVRGLRGVATVDVVAPNVERSAAGHAITLYDPLRVERVSKGGEFFGHAVNGTPADCVKFAVSALLDEPPDAVFAGINLGSNVGTNMIYSGTVSAAIEGAICGITSVAISLTTYVNPEFSFCAAFAARLLNTLHSSGLPKGVLLNVNVPGLPEADIKGVRITRQGRTQFKEAFDKRVDPQNRTYYWLTGEVVDIEEGPDVDNTAVREGYISITPVHYDLTNYSLMETLRAWRFDR